MEIDKKSPEARQFLVGLMDYLESVKKQHSDEAIHNEVVGQAHMENYALKVFLYADNEDRAGRFNKNVVKSFYTAGMLFDVLSTFGEISEDLTAQHYQKALKYCKYASSSLQYEDSATAIDNLQKALKIMTTGQDV
nr:hypothetical protein BaRGS_008266 [Batillaria attramentaria]